MVIKNAFVILESGEKSLDVRVVDGKIVEISKKIDDTKVEAINAEGLYLLPSLVDIGIKVFDRNLRSDTLCRLCENSIKSGFKSVAISSFTKPQIDNEITLEFVKSQAKICNDIEIFPLISGINSEGKLSDCSILIKEGGVGVEFNSCIDGNLIRRLMEYASMCNVKLFCHANDSALQGEGVMHEGEVSNSLGLAGVDTIAESSQVAKIGEFAEFYGVEVVILGASSPRTIEICSQSKNLFSQVSLHHAILCDAVCKNFNTSGKIWPPLREKMIQEEIFRLVSSLKVDMITSLHSPVSKSAKDVVFAESAYGIDGFSNFLPLLYTSFVKSGAMNFSSLVELISKNPASAIGLSDKKGSIDIGRDADLILFDPSYSMVCKDPVSPYAGEEIFGKVVRVF